MTPTEIDAFLREPRIADLATVRPDGAPHVAPVWFHYDGDKVLVVAEPTAVKLRNIAHDPRVSLSIPTPDDPYRYVIVRGTAEVSDDGPEELVRTMAIHYKGPEEGERYAQRINRETTLRTITITPTKLIGWRDDT